MDYPGSRLQLKLKQPLMLTLTVALIDSKLIDYSNSDVATNGDFAHLRIQSCH